MQTRRYDGRKWCDHSDTQCASSMHVNAIGGNRARMPDDAPLPTPLPPTSISGDSSRKWTLPDATDSITERRWSGVMLVWMHAPRTQSGNSLTCIHMLFVRTTVAEAATETKTKIATWLNCRQRPWSYDLIALYKLSRWETHDKTIKDKRSADFIGRQKIGWFLYDTWPTKLADFIGQFYRH